MPTLHLVNELGGQFGAGATERVTEGNRSTVDVGNLRVQAQVTNDR